MNLKEFATELKAENKFVKASIGGFSGSGKTRTGTEFIIGCYKDLKIDKPILLIDNEKGSRFLIPKFKEAGIQTYVKQTVELADILEAFKLLNSGQIGFLFIDSLSKVWYKFIEDYKSANKKRFMTLQDWGKILPEWQKTFSDKFVELNGNCVFTGRGGFTYDAEKDDETGKMEFKKSGVKMKMAGETPFEPDLNIWMELEQKLDKAGKVIQWREAQILKDRSGLIDGKTFKNPTYKDFQPVVKYLCDVEVGEVSKASSTENLAPSENNGWRHEIEQKEIEYEKIKNSFIEFGIGTSKEDKQLSVAICKKFFGTTSWKEVEKMKLPEMHNGRVDMEKLFADETFKAYTDLESKLEYLNNFSTEPATENELPFD